MISTWSNVCGLVRVLSNVAYLIRVQMIDDQYTDIKQKRRRSDIARWQRRPEAGWGAGRGSCGRTPLSRRTHVIFKIKIGQKDEIKYEKNFLLKDEKFIWY